MEKAKAANTGKKAAAKEMSERAYVKHAEVLEKVQKILDRYEPTKGLGVFQALAKLVGDLRAAPVAKISRKIAQAKEKMGVEADCLPACSCPKCLKEAGFHDMNLEDTLFFDMLGMMSEVMEKDAASFLGYSIVALRDDGEALVTTSRMRARGTEALMRIIGVSVVDFIIENGETFGFEEADSLELLRGAIAHAKYGGKYERYKKMQEMKSDPAFSEMMKMMSEGSEGETPPNVH